MYQLTMIAPTTSTMPASNAIPPIVAPAIIPALVSLSSSLGMLSIPIIEKELQGLMYVMYRRNYNYICIVYYTS